MKSSFEEQLTYQQNKNMWQVISIVFYIVMSTFVLGCICWAVRLCVVEWWKMKNLEDMENPQIHEFEAATHIRMSSVKQVYDI